MHEIISLAGSGSDSDSDEQDVLGVTIPAKQTENNPWGGGRIEISD
jgi:hypothetical protein